MREGTPHLLRAQDEPAPYTLEVSEGEGVVRKHNYTDGVGMEEGVGLVRDIHMWVRRRKWRERGQ